MRRGWILLLMLSLGLNVGLVFAFVTRSGGSRESPPPGPTAHARCPGGVSCPPCCPGLIDSLSFDHVSRLGRFLDLDRQQEERFSRLRRNLLPQILSARDEVRALRRRIHEQYRRAEVDSPEVRGLVARLAETQSRLDSLAAEAMLREAMLLTPAQRVRYFESMRWGAELCERPGSR